MARLAALVPPRRFDALRYHGVLAPMAAWRPRIVPQVEVPEERPPSRTAGPQASAPPAGATTRPRYYSWAELMLRVFAKDVLECPGCGSPMRLLTLSPQMANSSSRRPCSGRRPGCRDGRGARYGSTILPCHPDSEGRRPNTPPAPRSAPPCLPPGATLSRGRNVGDSAYPRFRPARSTTWSPRSLAANRVSAPRTPVGGRRRPVARSSQVKCSRHEFPLSP